MTVSACASVGSPNAGGVPFRISGFQFGDRSVQIQCRRIGQCIPVFHLFSMEDIADGHFDFLSADGVGDILHLDDFRGNVPWGRVYADRILYSFYQLFAERNPFRQPYEQDDPDIVIPGLIHHQGVENLREGFHLAVDFRRADSHPARVQGCVGPSVNDHSAGVVDLDIVSMPPNIRIHVKIGAFIFSPVRILPERNGHRGEGCGANQLPLPVDHRRSFGVETFHLHAQTPALKLSRVNGPDRVAEGETGDQIRSAGNRGQANVLLDLPVDIFEGFRGKGRTGGQYRFQFAQIVLCTRLDSGSVSYTHLRA